MKIKETNKAFDCAKCISMIILNSKPYCRMRLKDYDILSNFAKVENIKSCDWYKEK